MHHSTADQYANKSTFGALDPRVKLASVLILLVAITFLSEPVVLAVALTFVLTALTLSGVPAGHIIRLYAIALPFILFSILSVFLFAGINAGTVIFLRVSAATLVIILLASTTPVFQLVDAMRFFKMPAILCTLTAFTYRYIFLIWDELERMGQARQARGFRGGRHLLDRRAMSVIAITTGMIMLRSYRRGQRVQQALELRGYTGTLKGHSNWRIKVEDGLFLMAFVIMAAMLLAAEVMA